MSALSADIRNMLTPVGIASDEVKLARNLFSARKVTSPLIGDLADCDVDRLFICDGLWAADKLCERNIRICAIFCDCDAVFSDKDSASLLRALNRAEHRYAVSAKVCARISDRDGADSCYIIAEMPICSFDDVVLRDDMVTVILDGQEQPGNIGAIIRSLDGAGGSFAVMTNKRVRITHPRLVRASLGASFMMPVIEAEPEALVAWLTANSFRIVLTDLSASKPYTELDYHGRIAIVAGNEHLGISPFWRTLPETEPVIIPMLGSVESLNVGFASTLIAYDIGLKQRGF